METGNLGPPAPPLEHVRWIDEDGDERRAAPASAGAVPAIMEAYRSGGTPWFVVIAPDDRVVQDGFRPDAEELVQALRPLAA
ncbi:hypothetical protein [Propylenella binzhouense]|uniref:Uncharacterized protein n=1 Tax=Propylenella binzhouense TaxID=2555902 RepID=A0A964WT23_9HYPH|nr:hypothetical protein [Propylenella binzhouense]MYZ47496.1 hypothetical protein [Propylenella binzhouense]